MSTITGNDLVPIVTAADVAADGEAPSAATVRVGFEALFNGMASLVSRLITWTLTGHSEYGQKIPTFGTPALNKDARFTAKSDGAGGLALQGWQQKSVADGGALSWEIIPPHATARLASVEVRLGAGWGAGGSHGAFPGGKPAQMPQVKIHKIVDGVYSLIATVDEPGGITVGQYEVPHTLQSAVIDEDPMALGTKYAVSVSGEAGLHSIADSVLVMDATAHWTNEATP